MRRPRKRPSKEVGICILCASMGKDNVRGSHGHHLAPLEYGGPEDGRTVRLCENHHGEFHRLATLVYKGKADMDAITNATLLEMLQVYCEQRRAFDMGHTDAEDARRRIQVGFSAEELKQAHFVKIDLGEGSLESMIKALIRREFIRIRSGR